MFEFSPGTYQAVSQAIEKGCAWKRPSIQCIIEFSRVSSGNKAEPPMICAADLA